MPDEIKSSGNMPDEMGSNEKLIAYCGLCCLDCHCFLQKIPDMARDIRAELVKTKYKKFADSLATLSNEKSYYDYDKCFKFLGVMEKFRCIGCKNRAVSPYCKIRKCCEEKVIDGCWECTIFEECEKLDFLKSVHEDAHIKNINIIKNKGIPEFLNNDRYW
jgi:hypothetical protein